jgi:hypothetical protein
MKMKKYLLKAIFFILFVLFIIDVQAQRPPQQSVAAGWFKIPCDSCNGVAYITFTGFGAGPFTYKWEPDGGTNDTAIDLCNNIAYTVTVMNEFEEVIIERTIDPPNYFAGFSAHYEPGRCDEVCNGYADIYGSSTIGLTITAYNWFTGNPVGDGTDSVYRLCPDQAEFCAVTFSNGCVDTLAMPDKVQYELGIIQSFTSAICIDSCDGTANLYLYVLDEELDTVPAGDIIASYNWSPGTPIGDSTSAISRLCYGEYTCIITDTAGCVDTANYTIDYITDCVACYDCLSSFAPIPSKKYIVSGWVKEGGAAATKTSYTYPAITVSCPSISFTSSAFAPSGRIIDGWQRIEAQFTIPDTASDLRIQLSCSTGDCYFDDIRVFPFDGSMKSYVYDPVNMRLVAELDERNYATLYEYDEEGKLVRVKKETEKGIMTIKESRNNTSK